MIWKKASKAAEFKITPQVLRKWHSTELGELMVPDRFVDFDFKVQTITSDIISPTLQ